MFLCFKENLQDFSSLFNVCSPFIQDISNNNFVMIISGFNFLILWTYIFHLFFCSQWHFQINLCNSHNVSIILVFDIKRVFDMEKFDIENGFKQAFPFLIIFSVK